VLGDEVGALGAYGGEQLLEQRRRPDDDVDVVDPTGRMRAFAGDRHLLRQRLGPVGEDQIAVGGGQPGRTHRERPQHEPGADEAERVHSRLRVRPPSTAMVAPVT
jgi:hypothetical protein